MITFNANITAEVANTSLAAATPEGVFLKYSGANLAYGAAGSVPDAILYSEIVTDTEFTNRQYIYTEIDYGPYTKIGEPVSVVKQFSKLTAYGLAVDGAAGAISAGTELQVNAAGKLIAKAAGTAIGVAIDAIALNATKTGAVHLY